MKLLKVAQATAKQKELFLQDFLVPSSAAAGIKTRSGCTLEKQNYVHTQDQGHCDISNFPSPKLQLKAFKKHEAPTCARTQIKKYDAKRYFTTIIGVQRQNAGLLANYIGFDTVGSFSCLDRGNTSRR